MVLQRAIIQVLVSPILACLLVDVLAELHTDVPVRISPSASVLAPRRIVSASVTLRRG